jgi:hypothetical protein
MAENGFIDYYELLQMSSNADTDTIERVFRHFAKKFHPDNRESGDNDRFLLVVDAYKTLSDPEKRAGYNVKYQDYWNHKWKLASEARNTTAFVDDRETRESLLSILYVQRRRDMEKPGLGDAEMARLLSIPLELVEFHLWYLKAKGWVERLETGQLAISALGVDEVEQRGLRLMNDYMLAAVGVVPDGAENGTKVSDSTESPELPRETDFKQ